MLVCHCKAVNDRTVDAAVASGARTVAEVTQRCRAGGGCGSCHRTLQALIDAVAVDPELSTTTAA